jgi:hypothetical protein
LGVFLKLNIVNRGLDKIARASLFLVIFYRAYSDNLCRFIGRSKRWQE